ncbi:MAG: hypothetical protein CR972_02620 [Candidatus Moraniibacteriota bacterium]|nr:MAG: hypothetical protein CR972_02620 [Candidatus Moranbacteria bacterium]
MLLCSTLKRRAFFMFVLLPHASRIVLSASFGFVCGVAFASFFSMSIDVLFFVISVISVLVGTLFYRERYVWTVLVFLGFFAIAACITYVHKENFDDVILQNKGIKKGVARVVGDVNQGNYDTKVFVQFVGEDFTTVLTDEKHTLLTHGDTINLVCNRVVVESFEGFDYQKYLAMRGVYLECEKSEYNIIGHEDDVISKIAQFRVYMEGIVNEIIPAPESALANGLLFGGSARLSQKIQDDFSQTGMTHIVAVSGYNVSIIIAVVMGLLIFIGFHRRWAVWGAIFSVIFFVVLIGFPSSGIRAAIMGIMVLIAAMFGRVTYAYGAIIFSGAIMLAFNPLLLRYDIGFQLSFLATLGIVAIYPVIERIFIKKDMAFGLVEVLLLTLSAQIFVVPIIAYHFHTFSIVSLLVNVLVLPIIPFTMLFIVLMIPLHFIFYPFAVFCGWIAYAFLTYEVFIISFFAHLSFSSIDVKNFSVIWMTAYYIFVGSVVAYVNHKSVLYEK